MSAITDILDRLSAIEVVKERLRNTGTRVEQWANEVVTLNRQIQDVEQRLVRIETLIEVATPRRSSSRSLPRGE